MYTNSGFTSKLPISSARRPTHNRDGSTSFVGQSRPSNIPVTVRKANIFTPKTQRPFMTGTSTAGKSYMSIMTSEKKKYARPLKPAPDRDLQIKMFDNLVDFFRANAPHLPLPEAKKFFSSVSTTESSRIFELLISKITPDFKITKLETDVPEALAALDYPYIRSVTKSALVSVTTRQAAVGLLVIFNWLIEFIKCMEPTWDDKNDGDESIDEKRQIYEAILTNPPERVQEVCSDLFSRLYPIPDYHGTMCSLEDTKIEVATLEGDLAELHDLEQEVTTLREDISKSEVYYVQMEKYLQGLVDKGDGIRQQLLNYDVQNEERTKRNEQILAQVDNHEFTMDDVRKDRENLNRLEVKLDNVQQEMSSITSERNRAEKDYHKCFAKFKEMKIENSNQMKKLLSTYKSHDFPSKLWTERRLEIEGWVSRLELVPDDDLEQNLRLQHEQKLFLEKLSATDELLESEIRDSMTDKQLQLEALEASNERLTREILPRLQEAIDRVEREIEDEIRRGDEVMSRLQVKCEEEDRKIQTLMEKSKTAEAALIRDRDIERQRLEADKKESAAAIELSKKYLEEVKKRTHFQALALLKQAQSEASQFEEARKIAEENYQISKKALKLFKKKLDII